MARSGRPYPFLAILLLLSGAYWIAGLIYAVDHLRSGTRYARPPLDVGFDSRVIGVTPEATAAGVHSGDTLLTPQADLRTTLRSARPGDSTTVRIRRASDGLEAQAAIRLVPELDAPASIGVWIRDLGIQLVFPLFCLCLGFWVAAARPYDRNAWFLLAIMISLEFLIPMGGWTEPWYRVRAAWNTLCGNSWPVWMMFFGVYFPERSPVDRRVPWLKWLVSTVIVIPVVAGIASNLLSIGLLEPIVSFLGRIDQIAGMFAISLFFLNLGATGSRSSHPDARRRIQLVWMGASVGLTPLFIVALVGLFSGGNMQSSVPTWFFYFALGCLAIFPLTLAYVILVQRAMEVRMAIRQSAQYTIGRGVLWLLRGILVAIAIYIFLNVSKQEFHPFSEVGLILLAVLLLIFRRRFTDRFSRWLDKRFFREAYSTEQVLAEIGNEARKFVEAGPLLDTVTRRISETLHVPRISVLLRENGLFRQNDAALSPESHTIRLLRLANRPPVVYFDDPDSWLHDTPVTEQQTLKDLDAQLLLPLPGRDDLLGVMALGPKRSEEPYSKTDLQLLQSVAVQTGLALENARLITFLAEEATRRERLNREIEIAKQVQERLFPQIYPAIQGLDCAGRCRPAQGVGGDYYDFISLPNGRLGIAIGDISGKGIPAALLMAGLRASLRGQIIGNPSDLAPVMRNVNSLLYEGSSANRYATFFYAQYDPASRQLDFVNAGHNAPLVLRGPEVISLEASGPVVGLLPGVNYVQQSLALAPGDIFCGYTDGISEAMTANDEEWGEERMIAAIRGSKHLSSVEIIDKVIAAADEFTAGAPQHDDMTLLIIRVLA